jgi:hypothetical protein
MYSQRVRVLIGLILFGLAITPSTSQAQNPADNNTWQIWLFNTASDHLVVMSPAGIIEDIDLVDFTGFESKLIQRPFRSPDGLTLAFEVRLTPDNISSGSAGIYLANLETQDCCHQLTDPENPEFDGFHRGPFSPDGTQLVVSMWATGVDITPIVAVFDLTSGDILHRLPLDELNFQPFLENERYEAAVFNEWSADGIRIGGSCTNCPASLIFFDHTQIWNPETDELSGSVTVVTDPNSVLATGELIITTFDEDLPGGDQPPIGIGEGVGTIFPNNIVRYYTDHTRSTSEVIFNRPEPPMIQSAHWVVNGEYVLAFYDYVPQSSDLRRAMLLDRDGGQQMLEFFFDDEFLAPTPDGWLMCHYDGEQTHILHHQSIDGSYIPNSIATFDGRIACFEFEIAGQNFVLGEGLDAPAFAP